jgi:hypothetical protein
LVVNEIQRVHEDLGELVLLLLALDGIGAEYEEGEGPQELVLIGDAGLRKVKDCVLLVLLILQHAGEGTEQIENIDLVPLRVTVTLGP